jgi:hypothetical protein
MKEMRHEFDVCVVGGGMAGLIAAIAAARHGARVALVHDRPVLGGNASSEIRMHICGARGADHRETGVLEELLLENHYRNPQPNYSIWDSVLYGAAQYQPNLTLFLNASVHAVEMNGPRLRSVRAWQTTSETFHTIAANLFADCSGDGILAPLSGAEYRVGREGRAEYGESIAPVEADAKTMGLSCLFQAREHDRPMPFTPPAWAYRFEKPEDLRNRDVHVRRTNFWWMEVGGDRDSLHDAEFLREELVRIAFGVWDYLKNRAPDRETVARWALDWVGFLPGKRESRRYLGDHVMTQHDVERGGPFEDIVAYGGWTMDDHFPDGFYHPGAGTIFHPAPSPFGIAYRTLYSRTIENLFCAGRCHSATHVALSATRVMGTTSLMGQAVGTAAAIAARDGLDPRGVGERRRRELQETLMEDDVWLPGLDRPVPALSRTARLTATAGDPEPLRNGRDRRIGAEDNGWRGPLGAAVEYRFDGPRRLRQARLVFDSDLGRPLRNMPFRYALDDPPWAPPSTLVRAFRLEAEEADGRWAVIHREPNNYQRLVRVPLAVEARAVRLIPEATWGAEQAHLFAFDVRD